jgi:DNA-directed RNA polymerase specialized sigma24 family protein
VLQTSARARRCGRTRLQLRTLRRVWGGRSLAEIAVEDGVCVQAMSQRLRRAIHRIDGYEADPLMRVTPRQGYAARLWSGY